MDSPAKGRCESSRSEEETSEVETIKLWKHVDLSRKHGKNNLAKPEGPVKGNLNSEIGIWKTWNHPIPKHPVDKQTNNRKETKTKILSHSPLAIERTLKSLQSSEIRLSSY